MKTRKLGRLEVSAIGYGCMGLSMGYGTIPDKADSIRLLRSAYDQGCTFFDTAEIYGMGANEALLGEALQGIRNEVVIATKFMFRKEDGDEQESRLLRRIKAQLEQSLTHLRTDHVELYYQHRVNKDVPVEAIAWCMGELIREGKILGWGQSQATADEIRRAHAITPLTAVQSEYSMMERMFEQEVIPTCAALNIGFVAFSPLANGILSGKVSADATYAGFDARRVITRFEQEHMRANQPLLDLLDRFAAAKAATPAQVSLAWMLHQYDFIVPIPGSRKPERVKENFAAADLVLTDEELAQINAELAAIKIHGNRTDEDIARLRSLL